MPHDDLSLFSLSQFDTTSCPRTAEPFSDKHGVNNLETDNV